MAIGPGNIQAAGLPRQSPGARLLAEHREICRACRGGIPCGAAAVLATAAARARARRSVAS
jgi:hypothetical protein